MVPIVVLDLISTRQLLAVFKRASSCFTQATHHFDIGPGRFQNPVQYSHLLLRIVQLALFDGRHRQGLAGCPHFLQPRRIQQCKCDSRHLDQSPQTRLSLLALQESIHRSVCPFYLLPSMESTTFEATADAGTEYIPSARADWIEDTFSMRTPESSDC